MRDPRLSALAGWKALVHDAFRLTVDLVEEGHESTARQVMRALGAIEPLRAPAEAVDGVRRLVTRGSLGTIRGVHRVVEVVTDAAVEVAAAALPAPDRPASEARLPMRSDEGVSLRLVSDAAVAFVNGAVGDHLHARGSPLAIAMSLRHGDRYLELDAAGVRDAVPGATSKIAVFVHGLGTTEWSWCLHAAEYHGDPAASFGTMLARDLGYTPVFVRYNGGRHVSENGRDLASRIEALVAAWPVPVEELVLVGHSMGGLVARSACEHGRRAAHAWLAPLRRVFSLGTPHHGADLERLGHLAGALLEAIDTPGTRIPGRLVNGRSAGVKDLRHGSLVDEDWLGRDPDAVVADRPSEVPLIDGVRYYFLSATITEDPTHPLGRLVGDMLVRVGSASGGPRGGDPGAFPIRTHCFGGIAHHALQCHPDVYARVRAACAGEDHLPIVERSGG